MKNCIFGGPTISELSVPQEVTVFEPAVLGSIFRAVELGYNRIGLIDGFFGNNPSVWHKEILYALECGAEVFGSSSIGALRAAELHEVGMRGVGRVFQQFSSGTLTDDDEVCVLHGPKELGFRPLSEALVNTRETLNKLVEFGLISHHGLTQVIAELKNLHFSKRTREMVLQAVRRYSSKTITDQLYEEYFVDVKVMDAERLFDCMLKSRPEQKGQVQSNFVNTRFWRDQFENQVADVPFPISW